MTTDINIIQQWIFLDNHIICHRHTLKICITITASLIIRKQHFIEQNKYLYLFIRTSHQGKKRSSETDDLGYITYLKNINYFTLLQIAANASGLFIARSARTLRLMSILFA